MLRASIYATIMSDGWMIDIQPGNASAPTEPVAALHTGKSDRSPKRETIRAGVNPVKRGCVVSDGPARRLEHVLDQIHRTGYDSANDQQ